MIARQPFADLAAMLELHGNVVRRVVADGVLAAVAGTTAEGWACYELSGVLSSQRAVRDWLGY